MDGLFHECGVNSDAVEEMNRSRTDLYQDSAAEGSPHVDPAQDQGSSVLPPQLLHQAPLPSEVALSLQTCQELLAKDTAPNPFVNCRGAEMFSSDEADDSGSES